MLQNPNDTRSDIKVETDGAALPADQELQQALDQSLRFAPLYRSGDLQLSSHLPMVLIAMHRLGGRRPELQRALQRAERHLQAAAPEVPAPALLPAPGRPEDHACWRAHFRQQLSRRPALELLREHLPLLLRGPEATAFHGLIRLAYAWEAGHAHELAEALAHAHSSFSELGPALPAEATEGSGGSGGSEGPGQASLREVIEAAALDPDLAMAPRTGTTISDDLAAAHALPAMVAYLYRPRLSLDALAEASLALYLGSRDFTALHLLTGLHAARVLFGLLAPAQQAALRGQLLRSLWRAWLAAFVSIGRPQPDWPAVHQPVQAGANGEQAWQVCAAQLLASSNDHQIKLADSAREEWRVRGWPGYLRCLPGPGVPA